MLFLLSLIVPILSILGYYYLTVKLIKRKFINKIKGKKLRTIVFILLIISPIADHMIGYVVYKGLCYTKSGLNIYRVVTDKQEQRDYWFYNNLVSGILAKEQYTPGDTKFDADRESGRIEAPFSNKSTFKRFVKGSASGYLNYCKTKYNTLPKTDPNYNYSCTNADYVIKKYNLKDVIKAPVSPYGFYDNGNLKPKWNVVPLLLINKSYEKMYNEETGEILAESAGYTFWGGWLINIINPFHKTKAGACGPDLSNDLSTKQRSVIPNPYKK